MRVERFLHNALNNTLFKRIACIMMTLIKSYQTYFYVTKRSGDQHRHNDIIRHGMENDITLKTNMT